MVTYSRRMYSRRSYRRSGFSKGRRSSTFSSPLKASKVRSQTAGTDLAKFACKIPGKVILAPRVLATVFPNGQLTVEDVPGTVLGQVNIFEALASSEYFTTLRKLYDEVRLNSCSVKVFMDKSEGTLNVSSPSFLYKAAWDRNGLTAPAIPVDFSSRWDTFNRIPVASQYASCVTRSGNFYSAFSSTHSWTASSMGEKQQFISTRHMKDVGLIGLDVDGTDFRDFGCVGSVYRQRFRGLYDDQGMYSSAAAKPTLLIQLESSAVRTASMTFELNCDLTCRGVKVLDGSQFSEKIVNVKANQVQRGVAFKNSDDEVEVGEMVVVENEPLKTVGPLGGPIQIGIPGVKYDGACTIDMSWDPPGDDSGTYVSVSTAHFFCQETSVGAGLAGLGSGSFYKVSNNIRTKRIMAVLYVPKEHVDGVNDAFVCLILSPASALGSLVTPSSLTSVQPDAYDVYMAGFNFSDDDLPDYNYIGFYSDSLPTMQLRTTPFLFNLMVINSNGLSPTRIRSYSYFNPSIIDYTASLTDEPEPVV